MSRASCCSLLPLLLAFVGLIGAARAAEIPWPEGYESHDESESPDGRYGVVVPRSGLVDENNEDKVVNYLADLKSHRLLGVIDASHYFLVKNHSGLHVTWSPDSSCCAVVYEKRFGYDTITMLEIDGASFRQIDVGQHIDHALGDVIEKASHNNNQELDVDAGVYCRLSADRKFRIRALATTNPRQLDRLKTYLALFRGTFDLQTRKWTVSETRSINTQERDAMRVAYNDLEPDLGRTTFGSPEEKVKRLDDELNEVYQALRVLLKPERFAQVKSEQIAWLKKRGAASPVSEKCKLLEERINALRALVW